MNVTTINNTNYSLLQQAICKLKMTKCDENVIKWNNNFAMCGGGKGQDFFLCKCNVQLVNNIVHCYQTLIQLMLNVNSWKVVKIMIKQSHYSCK
jgi:hypothetical protein